MSINTTNLLHWRDSMRSLKTKTKIIEFEYYDSLAFSKDDDSDYKPILQGVINTRCNYDGAKIEGSLEG